MKSCKQYYSFRQFDIQKFENIEDKKKIHQFENKSSTINTEDLKDKYTLNQLR